MSFAEPLNKTTVTVITNNGSANVQRVSTYEWATTNVDAATLTSVNETSTDGLRNWRAAYGLTNQSRTVYSGGHRYVTNTAPEGNITVSDFQNGRLLSTTTRDSSGTGLAQITYGYDAHGRQSTSTDVRNGTTTNGFDNADRIVSVTTPPPESGQAVQVTTTVFNEMGWVTNVIHPDSAITATLYHLTGETATNSGARTYPVAYTYDYAGRLKTMTTWTNFSGNQGSAVTTWNYHNTRGWLTNKVYADSQGPTYTYTPGGRLSTRTWARGVTTTYSYNAAGDLSATDYSDATVDLTHAYDRRGRLIRVTEGGSVSTLRGYNDAGQIVNENYSGGSLDGWTFTNSFDSVLRPTGFKLYLSGTLKIQHVYTYDTASRPLKVSQGEYSANYSYHPTSSLISQIDYKWVNTNKLTSVRTYDNFNRLSRITNTLAADTPVNFAYAYNSANQRTGFTNADSSRWAFAYDTLGQVTSGKRYWSDGTNVAGQQFEYLFDDIGNRLSAGSGGDETGANLGVQSYTANKFEPVFSANGSRICGCVRHLHQRFDRDRESAVDLSAWRLLPG